MMIDVGKYGRMWIEHIKDVYPERYRCLVRFGELSERACQVNETAYELLEDIEVRWLRKHKPKIQILLWSNCICVIKPE